MVRILRFLVAAVLLAAAAAKLLGQPATDTLYGSLPPMVQVGLVAVEMTLGLWLITGRLPRAAALATAVLLSAFLGVIAFEYTRERPKPCGCAAWSAPASDPASVKRGLLASGLLDALLLGAMLLCAARPGTAGPRRAHAPLAAAAPALMLVLLLASPGHAAPPVGAAAPLLEALADGNAADVAAALDELKDRLARDPAKLAPAITAATDALLKAQRYPEAADLALRGTLALADQTRALETLQTARTRALLAQSAAATDAAEKAALARQAVQAAKSLFNVASLDRTADAIALVAEALAAAYPDDPGVAARFKLYQLAHAQAATAPASTAPASQPASPLAAIRIDPAPYDEARQRMRPTSFAALVARGNLQLLADNPAGALKTFREAYTIAPDKQLAAATENLARALRAQDGSVGRANALVLSLRPTQRPESADPR